MGKKVTRFDDWPDRDRCDWERAIADGDIFDERGPGATWSEGARCTVGRGYGRWIGHLRASRPDLLDCSPADRVTPGHVRAYVDMLNAGISPAGTFNYVKHLYDAIRAMAPGRDWTWLKDIAWRLNRYVIPRPKRGRMVDAERILDLCEHLLDEGRARS